MSLSTAAYLDSSSDDEDTLPYPTPLPRSDFLATDFEPSAYLATLRNRHQTLEDLRGDLRTRSQQLNQELLDLVNGNYEEFLSLGGDLKGGEEKVEGVRVGVLGFQREITGVRTAVQTRLTEVQDLLVERKDVRRDISGGRALLEIDALIGELEGALGVTETDEEEDDDEEDDEDYDKDDDSGRNGAITSEPGLHSTTPTVRKLQRHAQKILLIEDLIEQRGSGHPFLIAQKPRLENLRRLLLLDMATVLRQAKAASSTADLLALVRTYSDLGVAAESAKILKAR